MEERSDPLYKLRHSLAHVLAQAVLEIRPKAKLAFGPPVDNGFYYDFLFDTPLTSDDFPDIEKRMRRIINERQKFEQQMRSATEAISHLEQRGENFKVEYCKELLTQGETEIGFFTNGPFEDMCRGPHLEHTGQIPPDCFQVDSVAGAYWRGSEKNPQLTRIYGLAFKNKQELKDYIQKRELAKERDHRKLGKELELFMIADEVGPGLPLWLPNGTVVREELELFAKETEARHGYQRVATPHIAKEQLYYTSGHLPYYKDTMFPPMALDGECNYYMKAMNCPHHHIMYRHTPHSYRELPVRLAEYGTVYRNELSGTLAGLLRVRGLAMNDAHIYCRRDQIKDEFGNVLTMMLQYFKIFGLENYSFRLSKWDPAHTDKYVNEPENWEYAEQVLREGLQEAGVQFTEASDEAAFYGPKVDVQLTSVIGREETLSTIQLDFIARKRFELSYVDETGAANDEVFVIHRAPLSTHERFVAFLIEHYAGVWPVWLAPTQVVVAPVSDAFAQTAYDLASVLRGNNVRVTVDDSAETVGKKVRNAEMDKVPYVLVIGQKEVDANTVAVRRHGVKDMAVMPTDDFITQITTEITERTS